MLCHFVLTHVQFVCYVVHKQENLTPTIIHLGTHEHLVVEGKCKKVVKQIKALVHEEVSCTLLATPLVFVFVANKTFCLDTCSMRMVKGCGTFERKQSMPNDAQIHNPLFFRLLFHFLFFHYNTNQISFIIIIHFFFILG